MEGTFRRRKKQVGNSWRMDETYIRVKGEWRYLYRAVDKEGNTVDFMLTKRRNKRVAHLFLLKAIHNNDKPVTINIDKSSANRQAIELTTKEHSQR